MIGAAQQTARRAGLPSLVAAVAAALALGGAVLAGAQDRSPSVHGGGGPRASEATVPSGSPSVSEGTTRSGRLIDGARLPERGAGFHFESNRSNPEARYGTAELVQALMGAAAAVARVHPGSDLAIHDLSLPGGGPIRGHGSHRSGRDADVAYYAVDAEGARVDPTRSIWFAPPGQARSSGERFDAERTALFVRTLLADRSIRVQYVFMAPHLQRLLLAATPRGRWRQRASRALRTPRGRRVDPHEDHLHLRIHCPADDVARGCRRR